MGTQIGRGREDQKASARQVMAHLEVVATCTEVVVVPGWVNPPGSG